ncbi:hypothetical protein AB0K51_07200 [Kitasatospora sp. NPDC049285]
MRPHPTRGRRSARDDDESPAADGPPARHTPAGAATTMATAS